MLSGQLGPIGLDEVVGFLHTNGLEGVLTVVGAASTLSLVLQQGRLVYPDPHAGRLGPEAIDDLLARANGLDRGRKISRNQIDELMGRARSLVTGVPASRLTGRIDPTQVGALLDRAADLRKGSPASTPTVRPSVTPPRPSGPTPKPGTPSGSDRHRPLTPGAGTPAGSDKHRPLTPGGGTPAGSDKHRPLTPSTGTHRKPQDAPPPSASGKFRAPGSGSSGAHRALGDAERRTGRLDRDALESMQSRAEALDPEQTRRRARLAEQVHELFNWTKARFEFRPLPVPPGVISDIERAGGLVLEPQALLMEVARRSDERTRNPDAAASRTRTTRRRPVEEKGSKKRGPFLEGDLDGVGLAALLQTLRARKRRGTLMVTAGAREEHLYFDGGEAFVLRADVAGAEEFAASFLGEAADSVVALASAGVVDERSLSEGEQRVIKDRFLDVLFWEKARFCFYLDDLPSAFLRLPAGLTKIALQTDRFLLEAIQRMSEWDALRDVVRSGEVVFAFTSQDSKLQAIRTSTQTSILTLIDGRQTFDDLVRISREPRLEVGRAVADLARRGLVREVE